MVACFRVATRPGFSRYILFPVSSVPRPVVILAGTPVVRFQCYPVLGARNRAWNGNVWYFALSQELIFPLKVRQKAGIRICSFKIFPEVTPRDRSPATGGGDPLPHPPPARPFGENGAVLGHKL